MFYIQFAIVLVCILIGARIGGIGLGVMGGLGFVFSPSASGYNLLDYRLM